MGRSPGRTRSFYSFLGSSLVAALLPLFLTIPLSPAHADGKVFAPQSVVTNIPDQRALIHFANGVQTLVIETRFEATPVTSDGSDPSGQADFAWVVPLPSVPELIEVSP